MRVVGLGLLMLATPVVASAQLPILEGLFKKVTDVNLFYTAAWFSNRPTALAGGLDDGDANTGRLKGLGFEVSFDVGAFSPRDTVPKSKDTTTAGRQAPPDEEPPIDTLQIQKRLPDGTLLIYKPVPEEEPELDHRWQAELAIGYTEIRDFESADPRLDVRGTLREFPAVSLYAIRLPKGADDKNPFRYYLGVRTGLAQLHGLRAYVRDTANPDSLDLLYNGGGTTFQFGLLAGLVYDVKLGHVFVEPTYTHRRFSGVEWSGISGTISDVVPRSLDMSTWSVAIGVQIEINPAGDN